MTITLGGIPLGQLAVRLPDGEDECLRYAAEEFSRLYGCGADGKAGAGAVRFCLQTDEQPEAYRVCAENGVLQICGGSPRAVLYAVYALAERLQGYNRYTDTFPQESARAETFELNGYEFSDKPFFGYRYPLWFQTRDEVRNARLGVNAVYGGTMPARLGGSVTYAGNMVHTFAELLPPDQWFEQHPEYYAMDANGERKGANSQLCLTNPDVLELVCAAVEKRLEETPGAEIVSVSQNDNFNYCRCPACTALNEKYGGPQGSILTFVNEVARRVAKKFPHVQVDTLAYQYSRRPPVGIVPEKNVIIRLCSIECCGNHAIDDATCPQNRAFARDLADWSKITDNLFIWDYTADFINYLFPYTNLETLRRNMRYFADCGVKGVLSQGVHNSDGGEFAELKTYLLAKLMHDPYMARSEYCAEIEKFMRDWYGPGYDGILRYIEYLGKEIGNAHFHCYSPPDEILPARTLSDGTPDLSFYNNAQTWFALARGAAQTDEQRAHIDKSEIHLKYCELYNTMDRLYIQGGLEERAALERKCEKLYRRIKGAGIELVKEWGEGCNPNVTCFAISPRNWK